MSPFTTLQDCATKWMPDGSMSYRKLKCTAINHTFRVEPNPESHVVANLALGEHEFFEGCDQQRKDSLRFPNKLIYIGSKLMRETSIHRTNRNNLSSSGE
jgi:hypothetical protein